MEIPEAKPYKRLAYFPLEPLRARYTELLSAPEGWAETAFGKSFQISSFRPFELPLTVNINRGVVLDSVNRPMWALAQMIKYLKTTQGFDAIYFDDFFHPGVEAIPYSGMKCEKIVAYCWAQTFDKHDFTRSEFAWMRPYEVMMMEIATTVCVANSLLADLITTVNPSWLNKIEVVGLPFNSKAVRELANRDYDPIGQPIDVIFSSRLDKEKQAHYLPYIIRQMPEDVTFVIATGHESVKSNIPGLANHLIQLEEELPNFHICKGLEKPEYYGLLSRSKVQLNTALQDWVSFTLLEALTFDCLPVYPAYRSFIEEFMSSGVYSPELLFPIDASPSYIAEHVLTMLEAYDALVDQRRRVGRILEKHDETLENITHLLV